MAHRTLKLLAAAVLAGVLIVPALSQAEAQTSSPQSVEEFLRVIEPKWNLEISPALAKDAVFYPCAETGTSAVAFKSSGSSQPLLLAVEGWQCSTPKVSGDGSTFYFEATRGDQVHYLIALERGMAPCSISKLPAGVTDFQVSAKQNEVLYQVQKPGEQAAMFRHDLRSGLDQQLPRP